MTQEEAQMVREYLRNGYSPKYTGPEAMKKASQGQRYAMGQDLVQMAQEARNEIVSNTFQTNGDTAYSYDNDGTPFTFNYVPNGVANFQRMTPEQQRQAILDTSGGKVTVGDSVTNPGFLTILQRSLNRMNHQGDGNLVPNYTNVYDPEPNRYKWSGIMGSTTHAGGMAQTDPRKVSIWNTNFTGPSEHRVSERGWNTGGYPGEDYVTTHELSHAAQLATDDMLYKWHVDENSKAREKLNSYPIGYLFRDMMADFLAGITNGAIGIWPDEPSIGDKMLEELNDKYAQYSREFDGADLETLIDQAAANLGMDPTTAISTVSEYAKADNYETFAEAYTDVLLNGDNAAPFSKELIRLYNEKIAYWQDVLWPVREMTRIDSPAFGASGIKDTDLDNIMTILGRR